MLKIETLCEVIQGYDPEMALRIYDRKGEDLVLWTTKHRFLIYCGEWANVLLQMQVKNTLVNRSEHTLEVWMADSKQFILSKIRREENKMKTDFEDNVTYNPPWIKPQIDRVIFSNPATIVFWGDGTKTVVKCREEDTYDMEKGILWAIAKKYTVGHPKIYDNYIQFINQAELEVSENLDVVAELRGGRR